MKRIDLLLSRHGETIENRKHLLQGQLPGTLSELGIQQAEMLADRMKGEVLEGVVCSDLARSYDTALIVARRKGLKVEATPLLREMDWGIYTGKTLEDVDWLHLPPSVESLTEQYERAGEFIAFLRRKYEGKRVLAIGHGAFNRAIVTWIGQGQPSDIVNMEIMENTEIRRLVV